MSEHIPEHLLDLNRGVKDPGPKVAGAFLQGDDRRGPKRQSDVDYGRHRLGDAPDPDDAATEDDTA